MFDLETAVTAIHKAETQEKCFDYFKRYSSHYEYNHANYTFMTDHDSLDQKAFHGISTTYPEDWLKYYIENKFILIDPVGYRGLQMPGSFYWDDACLAMHQDEGVASADKKIAERMMNEAIDAGLADGVGFSFSNKYGEISILTVSRPHKIEKKEKQEIAYLSYLAVVFQEKYLSFFSEKKYPTLTAREREILLWASDGKTDLEIGKILSVSRATVRFHWSNIFLKLEVNNKLHATILAIRCKLIYPQKLRLPSADSER